MNLLKRIFGLEEVTVVDANVVDNEVLIIVRDSLNRYYAYVGLCNWTYATCFDNDFSIEKKPIFNIRIWVLNKALNKYLGW